MNDYDRAWRAYERSYERQKNEILTKLDTIYRDKNINDVYRRWLEQVIEFIKEQKG